MVVMFIVRTTDKVKKKNIYIFCFMEKHEIKITEEHYMYLSQKKRQLIMEKNKKWGFFFTYTGVTIHVNPPKIFREAPWNQPSQDLQGGSLKWALKFLLKYTYHFLPKSHSSKLRIFLYILYIFGKPPWNERKISLMPFWNLSHVWVTEIHLLNPKWKQYLKWIYTSRLDCMGKKLRDYPYMWTLPDHPGASRKWSPTPALPGVRQNLPDVKVQKKKKSFFFLNNFPDHHFWAYVW